VKSGRRQRGIGRRLQKGEDAPGARVEAAGGAPCGGPAAKSSLDRNGDSPRFAGAGLGSTLRKNGRRTSLAFGSTDLAGL
jgi:hypothetical protein